MAEALEQASHPNVRKEVPSTNTQLKSKAKKLDSILNGEISKVMTNELDK